MPDIFLLTARTVRNKAFTDDPGPVKYLRVPAGQYPEPSQGVAKATWVKDLIQAATWGTDSRREEAPRGDILVFIHGYNNSQKTIVDRHRQLQSDLNDLGFKGILMSFDWPCGTAAIAYLADRHKAMLTAMHLVNDGIRTLAGQQTPDCTINVHVLAHSMGSYVVREAFDDADNTHLAAKQWVVSQLILIAGDISSNSMALSDQRSHAIYRHCLRLTNYSNRMDDVLKLSNAKRLGLAERAGRVGLPLDRPFKAVNVDCTDYFNLLHSNPAVEKRDQSATPDISESSLSFAHSWYIGNKNFTEDLFETLKGDVDRTAVPTRETTAEGGIQLKL